MDTGFGPDLERFRNANIYLLQIVHLYTNHLPGPSKMSLIHSWENCRACLQMICISPSKTFWLQNGLLYWTCSLRLWWPSWMVNIQAICIFIHSQTLTFRIKQLEPYTIVIYDSLSIKLGEQLIYLCPIYHETRGW